MKKIFLVLLLVIMAHGSPLPSCSNLSYAGEQPAITIPNLNASGDVAYLYHLGFAGGVGADIVSYKDGLITLRGQALWAVDSDEREKNNAVIGVGLMLDVIKVVAKTQGQWQIGYIKPKIGPFVGYDFGNKRMDWGVVMQMLRIDF